MARLNYSTPVGQRDFRSTHWSLVLAATQPDSTEARAALARLCEAYWYPLYAYIRRRGHDPEQAKDLTQELFARLIEKQYLQAADRQRGRFRTFLLACAQHFLSNEAKKEKTLKRGGAYQIIALEDAMAEDRYGAEPVDEMSPERLFERRWALTMLDQTMEELKQEFAQAGKAAHFDILQVFLSGSKEAPASYAEIGVQLDLSEGAARQASFRMRARYGELLRQRVAQTVASPRELEDEMKHLMAALSG
jgi:RNA polymerase sigma factor (sigma-70 family)